MDKRKNDKIKYLLKKLADIKEEKMVSEILSHSKFEYKFKPNGGFLSSRKFEGQSIQSDVYDLRIYVTPTIFGEHYQFLNLLEREIRNSINNSTGILIDKLKIVADLDKLEVNEIEVSPIVTEWEQINSLQKKLISSLDLSKDSIDFQNIGNTSRTIMDKLSRLVFSPDKHVLEESLDTRNGKFKNQLRTYIRHELGGSENKEFRKVANSAVDLVCSSIDIMNTTTHKLNAEKRFAELCVICTLNVVNIVSIISKSTTTAHNNL